MDAKASFIRHARRLRWLMTAFMIALFASAAMRPATMPFLLAMFLPLWIVLLWRLRCWSCGDRLLRDGGAYLQMCKTGAVRWDMCRHKTCGAELR